MSPEHGALLDEVRKVTQTLEFHLAETHATLTSRDETLRLAHQVDLVANVVLGIPTTNFDGEIVRTGGMQALVTAYANGGMRMRTPWWLKVLVPAMITAIGGVVVALIGLIGKLP